MYKISMPTPHLPDQTVARFPAGTLAAIDRLVKPGKRAEAIREAVRQWLERAAMKSQK